MVNKKCVREAILTEIRVIITEQTTERIFTSTLRNKDQAKAFISGIQHSGFVKEALVMDSHMAIRCTFHTIPVIVSINPDDEYDISITYATDSGFITDAFVARLELLLYLGNTVTA